MHRTEQPVAQPVIYQQSIFLLLLLQPEIAILALTLLFNLLQHSLYTSHQLFFLFRSFILLSLVLPFFLLLLLLTYFKGTQETPQVVSFFPF